MGNTEKLALFGYTRQRTKTSKKQNKNKTAQKTKKMSNIKNRG
jgi:hypothetical protein